MLAGHFSTALIANQKFTKGTLLYFLIASQLQDLLWFAFHYLGLEPTGPADVFNSTLNNLAVDMLYSHDLLPQIFWLIASTLDLIGDKWSLLIIRDLLLNKKKTYKELITSDEGIATNLLSSRLKLLQSIQIITKRKLPNNKKENIYLHTKKGIDLAPLILEIVLWSDKYVREYNLNMNDFEIGNASKKSIINQVQKTYEEFKHQTLN